MDSTISKLLVSRRAFFTRAYGSVYAYAMQGLVPIHDDWAVLSDGSIALVRGHIGQLCDAEFRRGNPRSRRQRVDSADGSGAAAAWSARLRRGQHVRPTVRPACVYRWADRSPGLVREARSISCPEIRRTDFYSNAPRLSEAQSPDQSSGPATTQAADDDAFCETTLKCSAR
jgi:hypothetical protein